MLRAKRGGISNEGSQKKAELKVFSLLGFYRPILEKTLDFSYWKIKCLLQNSITLQTLHNKFNAITFFMHIHFCF